MIPWTDRTRRMFNDKWPHMSDYERVKHSSLKNRLLLWWEGRKLAVSCGWWQLRHPKRAEQMRRMIAAARRKADEH